MEQQVVHAIVMCGSTLQLDIGDDIGTVYSVSTGACVALFVVMHDDNGVSSWRFGVKPGSGRDEG